MAKTAGISFRSVQRIWAGTQPPPHRIRTFKRSATPSSPLARGHRPPLRRPPGMPSCSQSTKNPRSCARSHPARTAAQARQDRHDDPRLSARRHHHLVRALNLLDGTCSALHAAPPPPGVPALSERDRGSQCQPARSSTSSSTTTAATSTPRCCPGSPAIPASSSTHADLGFVAEHGRTFFSCSPPAQARSFHSIVDLQPRSTATSPAQRLPQALHLTKPPRSSASPILFMRRALARLQA